MTTTTRTMRTVGRVATAALTGLALVGATLAFAVGVQATPSDKIMICHATSAISNPYTTPDVDMSSVDEAGNAELNGHGDHDAGVLTATMVQGDEWGDIIPPFTYTFTKHDETITVTFTGLNWTTAGQAIYNNGCTLPPPPRCPADAAVHAGEVIPEGQTAETFCTLPPPPRCAADAAVHAGEVIPAGQTAETFCTLPPPEEVTPVTAAEVATVPEVVAPVEAATVTEEPETVAVPAPATVPMPATVPAGDGSTVPQVPVALLALLALATAAAVTSGLRMATTR